MINPPELGTRSFWWFQAVGWTCFYLLSILVVLPYVRQPQELGYQGVGGLFWDQAAMCLSAFVASLGVRPLCRWLLRQSFSWIAVELYTAGMSSMFGSAGAVFVKRILVADLELLDLLEAAAKMSVLLFLWCNLYFSIKRAQQYEEERERLRRAESEAHEAQLRALRYQLNPHFLFNSMNAVSTLVAEGNAPAATKMLTQIADFLRATLDGRNLPVLPLAQEVALTERYLAIEHTRLGDRLRVEPGDPARDFGCSRPWFTLTAAGRERRTSWGRSAGGRWHSYCSKQPV